MILTPEQIDQVRSRTYRGRFEAVCDSHEELRAQRDEAMALTREAQGLTRDAIVSLKVAIVQRDELFKRLRIVLQHGTQCEHYDNAATEAALAAVDPDWMTSGS